MSADIPVIYKNVVPTYVQTIGITYIYSDIRSPTNGHCALEKNNTGNVCLFVCLFSARQPPVGQGLLIHEVSRSHTMTHHSQ